MSIMMGVGRGAQAGVLIKNAEALEHMEKVDTLFVDKTGTLTEGKPAVTAVVVTAGFSASEVLGMAAALSARASILSRLLSSPPRKSGGSRPGRLRSSTHPPAKAPWEGSRAARLQV